MATVDAIRAAAAALAPLYIQPCAGLANRLRALVSAMCAAEDLGRPLEIVWTEEAGICQVAFQRLFAQESLPSFVRLNTTWRITPLKIPARMCLSPADWNAVEARARANPVEPVFLKSYGHFYQSDPTRWLGHLRSLQPTPVIAARLTGMMTRATGRPVIGVHIRRTDNERSVRESPTSLFLEAMRTAPPDTMFYIATDDPREKATAAEFFPGRVLMGSRVLNRFSAEGGEDALLDFLALAASTAILGSAASSFSEIAAAYGGKPLTVLRLPPPQP